MSGTRYSVSVASYTVSSGVQTSFDGPTPTKLSSVTPAQSSGSHASRGSLQSWRHHAKKPMLCVDTSMDVKWLSAICTPTRTPRSGASPAIGGTSWRS